MMESILFVVGLLVGAGAAWFLASSRWRATLEVTRAKLREGVAAGESTITELRSRVAEQKQEVTGLRADLAGEQKARIAADTRVVETLRNIEEQRKLLSEAEKRFKDTFKALSAEALASNNEQFARQAESKVKPLKEALDHYDKHLREIEKQYGGVSKMLEALGVSNKQLEQQTSQLVSALRDPRVKGRWGEVTLRRVVEVAGMSAHCDFVEQESVDTEQGRQRPDLVVKLPGEHTIIVDSKAPTEAYLDAVAAPDEETRKQCLIRHARAVRGHMKNLAGKDYWRQFDNTPDLVVLFLPGESFFSAALEQDRTLIEYGAQQRVILATPTTLIALLRAVAYSLQQRQVADNARQIADAGKELFDRITTFAEHLARMGTHFRKATDEYNKAVGAWQSRVQPSGRRIAELGVTPADHRLPDLPPVTSSLRPLPMDTPDESAA